MPPDRTHTWQIPREADWPLARLLGEGGRGLFWLALAAPVFVFLALSPETRAWGAACLTLYVLLVVVLFARRLAAAGQEPDVRLAPESVSFRIAGDWFEIPREKLEAFRIEQETSSDAQPPALILAFTEGFESWPLEIHPPATPALVRSFLADELGLAERPRLAPDEREAQLARLAKLLEEVKDLEERQQEERIQEEVAADARRLGFLAEAHLEARTWRFAGTHAGLVALCRRWEEAAESLRIAPEYARPESVELGGWAMRLMLEADEEAWLSHGVICGPPEWHRRVAREALRALESHAAPGKIGLEVPETRWRLLWVVRPEGFDPTAALDDREAETELR